MRGLLLVLTLLLPATAAAEEVLARLSENDITISTNWSGTRLRIFGAIRREAPIPPGDVGVVIAVAGPDRPVVVRRKERVAGIWANAGAVDVAVAPSFYAVASTGPLSRTLSDIDDARLHITLPWVLGAVDVPAGVDDAWRFLDALVRIRERSGLYQLDPGGIVLTEATLFDTEIALPANLTEGAYAVRIFLTRDERVLDVHADEIFVRKVGMGRYLHLLATERPLLYGLMSLAIAVGAGWAASTAFRYLRS